MYKIIFVDFDGTLFSHKTNQIPPSAVEALNTAHDKGVLIYLCTGRNDEELVDLDLSGVKIDGVVGLNGNVTYDSNYKLIDYCCANPVLKQRLLEVYNEKKILTTFFTTKGQYTNFSNDYFIKIKKELNTPFGEIGTYNGDDILLTTCYCENEKQIEEVKKLADVASICSWYVNCIDLANLDANKAQGIKRTIKRLNINLSEVIAFGDGGNDIEMVSEVGLGIAMGNSELEVLKNAAYITDDVDHDGIYNALKHFKVI